MRFHLFAVFLLLSMVYGCRATPSMAPEDDDTGRRDTGQVNDDSTDVGPVPTPDTSSPTLFDSGSPTEDAASDSSDSQHHDDTAVDCSGSPDSDGDGRPDGCDNCPNIANCDQSDRDGNGIGDACEPDADGDGVDRPLDNCDLIANPGQEDFDRDEIGDACDNCPMVANWGQMDSDSDGDGDACESDPCIGTQSMCTTCEAETCDGTDNDCDSRVDNGCFVGTCAPGPELCDGFDNDCDGFIDEGCGC